MSSVISFLKMNKITQHGGRERPTEPSDVAMCSLGLEGIPVAPGDMFLSIAKVCHSLTAPVVHTTQSMSMTKSDNVDLQIKLKFRFKLNLI